jgi:hypothetical protein
MSEETVVQESSAEAVDVFNGENVGVAEFNHYRETGELPERFKTADKADSAPADKLEETAAEVNETESAGESETPNEEQEQPRPKKPRTAPERIAQIDATINKLWDQEEPDIIKIGQLEATREKIEQRAGLKRKTETAPVTPQAAHPQTYKAWEEAFNPEQWIEDYAKAHPEASYERANTAMFTHMLGIRDQFQAVEQTRRQQVQTLAQKVEEGKAIYGEEFGDLADQAAGAILSQDLPQIVRDRFAHSDVLPHLVYMLGSDPAALADFLKTAKSDAFKALDQIALTESLVREEIGNKETERNDKGQFKSPAKPKTGAPKPPSPVSGASTGAFDVSDESLSPEEWMRRRNADLKKRG